VNEERRMILEMLAEKKITAEEAAELLRALGGSGAPEPDRGATSERAAYQRVDEPDHEGERHHRYTSRHDAGGRSILEDFLSKLDIDWSNLGLAFGGEAFRFEEERRGEFAPSSPVELDLTARNGRVEIYGWDEPGWRVIMRKKIRAQDEERARQRADEISRFEAGESRLFFEEHATSWGNTGVSVEIHVPRGLTYNVRAKSSNGRVIVEGVRCTELAGKTANGKVSVRDVKAKTVDLSTANGGVTFEGGATELECRSANGQINLCPLPEKDMRCRLHTSNGSIRVRAPEASEIGYSVDAHTGHGGLDVALAGFEVNFEEKQFGRRRLRGRSRGYDGKRLRVDLSARTSNGSIRITQGPMPPMRGAPGSCEQDDEVGQGPAI